VTSPSKRKGDSAELEAAALLHDLLGFPVRRQLGAGRADDVGDLTGIPDTVIQVANRPSDGLRAIREKPLECEVQRERARTVFAATLIRLRGGCWRVVLTPEQFATLLREALAPADEGAR
jgi:hypothetical protein